MTLMTRFAPVRLAALYAFSAFSLSCTDSTGPAAPARIEISERSLVVGDGASDTLSAAVYDNKGKPIAASIEWRSSDASVAPVDSMGIVHGLQPGSAVIYARLRSARARVLTDSVLLRVERLPAEVQALGFNRFATVTPDESFPIFFKVLDHRKRPLDGAEVHFSIASGAGDLINTTTRTNSHGFAITQLRLGPTVPTATIEARAVGTAAVARFPYPAPTRGGLDKDSLVLWVGCPDALRLQVWNADGHEIYGQSARYTALDTSVVRLGEVSTTGTLRGAMSSVTGMKVGSTQVIARWIGPGHLMDTALVKVVEDRRLQFQVSSPGTISLGQSSWINVFPQIQCPTQTRSYAARVRFHSLDPQVAAVSETQWSSARITGLARGVGRIELSTEGVHDTVSIVVQ